MGWVTAALIGSAALPACSTSPNATDTLCHRAKVLGERAAEQRARAVASIGAVFNRLDVEGHPFEKVGLGETDADVRERTQCVVNGGRWAEIDRELATGATNCDAAWVLSLEAVATAHDAIFVAGQDAAPSARTQVEAAAERIIAAEADDLAFCKSQRFVGIVGPTDYRERVRSLDRWQIERAKQHDALDDACRALAHPPE